MLFLITLLIAGIPLYLLYIHLKWAAEDQKIGASGPPCIPIVGNFHILWKDIRNVKFHEKLLQLANEYGETIRLRFGHRLIIFTRDLKIIEQIVNNPKFEKSHDYQIYQQWLGNGLIFSSGEKWHRMRKLLTPAFHFQILERFISVYDEQGQIFLSKLKNLSKDQVIDIVPWFHAFTFDVISETSMGYKSNAQMEPMSKFVQANKELLNTIFLRYYNPLYRLDWIWKQTKYHKKVNELIDYFHEFVDNVISKRRESLLSENSKSLEKQKPALLDILLQSSIDGKPLSDKDIRDEVNGFILAGHETTGTTLGFLTFMLAKHPQVQTSVFEEIKASGLDKDDQPLTIRAINSLFYLDSVIKETLRIYPILAGAHKQCPEDIRIGNIFIPANTPISTQIRSSHLYDKNFKDPLMFDPNRWNDEVTTAERNAYAYQPFSSGLRNCIGQKFALLEMKTLMIHVLREYKIVLGHEGFEVDLRHGSLLFSANGVQVQFKKRIT